MYLSIASVDKDSNKYSTKNKGIYEWLNWNVHNNWIFNDTKNLYILKYKNIIMAISC